MARNNKLRQILLSPQGDFALVPLTHGEFAKIDVEDIPKVEGFNWNSSGCGYAHRRLKGKILYLHRFINNSTPGEFTDHINGDKLDNRKNNLRSATNAQNLFNMKPHKDGSSQYKGVYWAKGKGKWRARIQAEGRGRHIGYYECEEDAALAYDREAIKYFKNYARPNLKGIKNGNN